MTADMTYFAVASSRARSSRVCGAFVGEFTDSRIPQFTNPPNVSQRLTETSAQARFLFPNRSSTRSVTLRRFGENWPAAATA